MRRTLLGKRDLSSSNERDAGFESMDSLERFLGMVFGHCVVACHAVASRLTKEATSWFSEANDISQLLECLLSIFSGSRKSTRDQSTGDSGTVERVDVGCEIRELSDTITVLGDWKDSSALERVLTTHDQEIWELKRAIASLDQRTFPKGKWSSHCDDSILPEYKSIHRFRFSNRPPFKGVIAFLTKQSSGNVSDQGIIGLKYA
jgi:hypothetical protein